MDKKILITGAPGTGKTSIINQLKNHEDINENIIETLTNVIDHYESSN